MKVGTLIGKTVGFVSANIHSSVSGTVLKIDKALDTSGYKRDAVFIQVEGDQWEEKIDRSETWKSCTLTQGDHRQDLRSRHSRMGCHISHSCKTASASRTKLKYSSSMVLNVNHISHPTIS